MTDASGPTLEREALRALFYDDLEQLDACAQALGDVRYFNLLTTAAAAVVFRLFPEDPDPGELPGRAQSISGQLADGVTVPPAVVEAVIRASLGEYDLVKGVPAIELLAAYFLLVRTALHGVLADVGERDIVIEEVVAVIESA